MAIPSGAFGGAVSTARRAPRPSDDAVRNEATPTTPSAAATRATFRTETGPADSIIVVPPSTGTGAIVSTGRRQPRHRPSRAAVGVFTRWPKMRAGVRLSAVLAQ